MSHIYEYQSVFVQFIFRLGILLLTKSSKSHLLSLFANENDYKGNPTANYNLNTIEMHFKYIYFTFNGFL